MSELRIHTSELASAIPELRVGDRVLLSGTVFTSRDTAHKRIFSLLDQGLPLPYPLKGSVIYYAGPTPAQKGMAVGSCGPTTSSRMDPYAPRLLDLGLTAMIGKGERSQAVIDAIVRNQSAYFCAVGGAGALIACCIKSAEEIAFHDLGCESVKRFTIEDLPVFTAIDSLGQSIFAQARETYGI
ncbi:MAG: FumA C-terminus/TtdB family hydratase beta subunit [Oscillospiraceae bacterium]|nr:FumA C-terminus/TtdB family hydratase beta subunit [Oscillospiraceae bacterium]